MTTITDGQLAQAATAKHQGTRREFADVRGIVLRVEYQSGESVGAVLETFVVRTDEGRERTSKSVVSGEGIEALRQMYAEYCGEPASDIRFCFEGDA